MLASYLYGTNKLDKDTFVSAFLSLMIQGEDAVQETEIDTECSDVQHALQGLANVIESLWQPTEWVHDQHDVINGTLAESLFRETWVKTYLTLLHRKGYHKDIKLSDEKAVADFIERGNSPDWDNPVASGEVHAPRWLIRKAAEIQGEVDADRTADFYREARSHEMKKNSAKS